VEGVDEGGAKGRSVCSVLILLAGRDKGKRERERQNTASTVQQACVKMWEVGRFRVGGSTVEKQRR
jgi:hypothetical protein